MTEMQKSNLNELRQLRDEIRLKAKLAGMEVRDWWGEFEPKLEDLEAKIEHGGERAADLADVVSEEFAHAFRRIRDRMAG